MQYGYLEFLSYKPRVEVIIEKLLEVSIKILVYLCDLKIFQHQMLLWFTEFPYSLNKHWVNNKCKKRFSLASMSLLVRIGTWVNASPWVPLSTFSAIVDQVVWSSSNYREKVGISAHSYTKEWFLFGKVRQKGQLFCIIPKYDTQNNIIGCGEERWASG